MSSVINEGMYGLFQGKLLFSRNKVIGLLIDYNIKFAPPNLDYDTDSL